MAAPTRADFRSEFPELDGQSDDKVDQALKDARRIHNIRPRATLHLAAHLLVGDPLEGQPDGGTGVISSRRLGPMTVQLKTMVDEDAKRAFYATSSYGRRFLELEDHSPRAVITARVIG